VLLAVGWALTGLAGAGAVAVGVRRHRPLRPRAWACLAAAILAGASGDVTAALAGPPMLADLSYLAMFPLITIGLLQLTEGGSVLVDRAA
jgi:hypothetical protein